MPNPAETFVRNGNNATFVRKVVAKAKQLHPAFPTDGCAFFQSSFLELSGFGVGFHGLAETLATVLKTHGWKRIGLIDYQPGDIGVTADLNGNNLADHIYMVLERKDSDLMMILDNQESSRPHRRRVHGGDGRTRTEYFLRYPLAATTPITVKVQDDIVQDAGGYLTPEGVTFAWVRPVATALGATIADFDNDSVTLLFRDKLYTMPMQSVAGKGFVALKAFRNLPGIQVRWNGTINEARILSIA